ncbi:MAG: hypothetical protein AAFR46_18770, partial [Pseudomonadota bacterium]
MAQRATGRARVGQALPGLAVNMADAPAARLDASAPAAAPAPQAQTRAQGSGSTQSATPSTAWLGSRLALGLLIALICVVPFVLVLIISLGN